MLKVACVLHRARVSASRRSVLGVNRGGRSSADSSESERSLPRKLIRLFSTREIKGRDARRYKFVTSLRHATPRGAARHGWESTLRLARRARDKSEAR